MLKKTFLKKIVQSIMHILFWCVVLFFYTYFFGVDSNDFTYVFYFSVFLMPTTVATTYVFVYKIIPDYLVTKRYFLFTRYSLYTVIISSYLIVLSVFYALVFLSNLEYQNMAPISKSILLIACAVYLVVIIASAFKLLKLNLQQAEDSKKLETKILETQLKLKEQELKYLKTQIHPHFLFNTLNTIYGFALKNDRETPEIILKLSNLLDYTLYKIEKPLVPLIEEIQHIENYIDLEKIRFKDTLDVSFNYATVPDSIAIAPMLLLTFTENSFKHGILKDNRLTINIELKYTNNQLYFYIENFYLPKNTINKGIGLENTQKRLDLVYPNKHHLDIKKENHTFKTTLTIDLS